MQDGSRASRPLTTAERTVLRRVGRNHLLAAGYGGAGVTALLAGFLLVDWACSVAGYRTGGCSSGPEALLLVLAGLLFLFSAAMLRGYLRRRRLVARILESGHVEELRGTPARIHIPKEFRFQLFDRQVRLLVLNLPAALRPFLEESPMTLVYAIGADHDHWSQAWVVSVNAKTALWPWEVEVVSQGATGPHGWSTA